MYAARQLRVEFGAAKARGVDRQDVPGTYRDPSQARDELRQDTGLGDIRAVANF
jgi:hypothetical protein